MSELEWQLTSNHILIEVLIYHLVIYLLLQDQFGPAYMNGWAEEEVRHHQL